MNPARTLCSLVVSISALSLVQACGSDASGPEDQVSADGEELYTRTIVRLNPDGTQNVKLVMATAEEMQAETELRKAYMMGNTDGVIQEAITKDTSCADSSLWINDQLNNASAGNRICFYGQGWTDVGAYCRQYCGGYPFQYCCAYWRDNVRSYWSGNEVGVFLGTSFQCGYNSCSESFNTYQRVDDAGSCAEQGDYIRLGSKYCVLP